VKDTGCGSVVTKFSEDINTVSKEGIIAAIFPATEE
jgi:hypothetical protein